MNTSSWKAQYEPFGGAGRKRREAVERARYELILKRWSRVHQAAESGDTRAAQAVDLWGKTGYDNDAVLNAFETGGKFPKRRYKTQAQRYYEFVEKVLRDGGLLYWVADNPARRREIQNALDGVPSTPPVQVQSRRRAPRRTCAATSCTVRFVLGRSNQRFCSAECRVRARNRRGVVHVSRSCDACGQVFTPKNMRARYCSDKCRVRVWDRRQVEMRAETQPISIQR